MMKKGKDEVAPFAIICEPLISVKVSFLIVSWIVIGIVTSSTLLALTVIWLVNSNVSSVCKISINSFVESGGTKYFFS